MKKKGIMQHFVSGLVFLLICVVPFGSWYYLQSGLDYRRAALEELKPKSMVELAGLDISMLKSKTTLFHLQDVDKNVMPEVYDQYSKSETYQVFSIDVNAEAGSNWITIDKGLAQAMSSKYGNAGFILVDTAMMIRNTYNADKEGITKMIEHTSIVLPRIKEIDIKMKGNDRE